LKIKPYICDLCGKNYASIYKLRSHLNTVHAQAILKCPHCEKTFNRRIPLLKHLKFHLNPRIMPYKCVMCKYCNDRKNNVSDHIKKVHKKEWTQEDIFVDREAEARMNEILWAQADEVQGYKNGIRRPTGYKKIVTPKT